MNVTFGSKTYELTVWSPSRGSIGGLFSYDTETTLIDEAAPWKIPDLVLATAFDGERVYLIKKEDLAVFWALNADARVVMHHAAFDLQVTEKAAAASLRAMVEAGRVLDTGILYRLRALATTGELSFTYNLAQICKELCGVVLEKTDAIRCNFGQFLRDGRVDYASIPAAFLQYAARDAIATHAAFLVLEPECRSLTPGTPHLQTGTTGTTCTTGTPDGGAGAECRSFACDTPHLQTGTAGTTCTTGTFGVLGHDIQLKGEIALGKIQQRGLCVDQDAVKALARELDAEIIKQREILTKYGYIPETLGITLVYEQIMAEIEKRRGTKLPLSPKHAAKSQKEEDLHAFADEPFVQALQDYKEAKKIRTTYLGRLEGKARVFPKYTSMVKTGRTSCSGFNVQNLPRKGHVRDCIVASPGHVLIACDYSMLELCTLAQVAYTRFGYSRMRDLINQGTDLHKFVAGQILGKPPESVTKDERQKAKAVDFGLPGGMGVGGLREYARNSYGVMLAEDEAEAWRNGWLNSFPEMREYLDGGDDLYTLGATLNLKAFPGGRDIDEGTAAKIVLRIAGGNKATSKGRAFTKDELTWAWDQIARGRASRIKRLAGEIDERSGSKDLQQAIKPGYRAVIPTGRVRAECSYTESKNWPFQALASDGAKLALYDLVYAGFEVVAFIHDEVLVEVPEAEDYRAMADAISGIMVKAMGRVCPDVRIATEYAVMRRWSKGAKAIYDSEGRLIPCDEAMPHQKAA